MLFVSCISIKLGKINKENKTSGLVVGIENLVRTDAKLYLITISQKWQKKLPHKLLFII